MPFYSFSLLIQNISLMLLMRHSFTKCVTGASSTSLASTNNNVGPGGRSLRSDLLVAADSVTNAMSTLVRELNSGMTDIYRFVITTKETYVLLSIHFPESISKYFKLIFVIPILILYKPKICI